jgi:hypothetical protein
MARSIPTPSHVALGAWVAACRILAAPFLDAGPHYFWRWKSGVITRVNAATHKFANDIVVSPALDQDDVEPATPESVSTDRSASVLGSLVNKKYVAERIILNSARC